MPCSIAILKYQRVDVWNMFERFIYSWKIHGFSPTNTLGLSTRHWAILGQRHFEPGNGSYRVADVLPTREVMVIQHGLPKNKKMSESLMFAAYFHDDVKWFPRFHSFTNCWTWFAEWRRLDPLQNVIWSWIPSHIMSYVDPLSDWWGWRRNNQRWPLLSLWCCKRTLMDPSPGAMATAIHV